jgi:hypothetical protein
MRDLSQLWRVDVAQIEAIIRQAMKDAEVKP